MSLNLINVIIFLLVVGFAIWGIFKGFVRQIVSIVALILGVWCAAKFAGFCAFKIANWFDLMGSVKTIRVVMFVVIFLAVAIIANFIGTGIERIVRISMLEWLNRLLGFVFAGLKIIIILSIIASVIDFYNPQLKIIPQAYLEKSECYQFLRDFYQWLFPYLRDLFEK